MFLKNKNIIFKIRRSKVTDYAALIKQGDFDCEVIICLAIDKQKALKRDGICNIENTDLEIGVSGGFFSINYTQKNN